MRRFKTILIVASLLLVRNVAAQQAATTSVPNLIRYSGTLRDVPGVTSANPTTIGVTFAIYRQQDGGAPVWQETQNVTPEASGQYNVILGSTTATGLPDDLFSQQEQRWLGVQVQGQEEQVRVMLVSVPYAFKAHEAETLGGLPASAFLRISPSDPYHGSSVVTSTPATSAGTSASPGKAKLLAQTPGFVPVYNGAGYSDSLMSQALTGATGVNVGGNFNLSPFTSAYQIGGFNVLRLGVPFSSTGGNLFVGVGAGSGSSGTGNTFVGTQSGFSNFLGSANTFVGVNAGYYNNTMQLTGDGNSYFGNGAGANNQNGSDNTFAGALAGINSAGGSNTYYGYNAGAKNNGTNNTFVGAHAGEATAGGSGDIYIGANVHPSDENETIRIGTAGGSNGQTFIGGIYNKYAGTGGVAVYVAPTGKLGSGLDPSDRTSEQIIDMGAGSNKLFQLRPVSFFYKSEYDGGAHQLQYGLIAEEVARVYPEMAVYDKDGQPFGVKYQLLAPMLLNELQKEHKIVIAQQDQIKAQSQEIDGLKRQLQQQNASLQERLTKLESYVGTQMKVALDTLQPAARAADGGLQ